MQKQKNILLLVTGHTIEPVRTTFGNTDAHFAHAVGQKIVLHPYAICEEWPNIPAPNPASFDGVIMTGSASMIEEDQPWMRASKKLVLQCLIDDIPFLGVCFGHQILGAVCGAAVGPNPKGRANGSCEVEVTRKAAIFSETPTIFTAQISHRDVILENRSEFQVIATANHDPRHAIQVGKNAFGVQFHPEWNMDLSKAYIDVRQSSLGEELAAKMRATLAPSPDAKLVIQSFVDRCR